MTIAKSLSCPIIEVIGHESNLKIKKLDVKVEAHVSIAFVKLNIIYYNHNDVSINGRFLLNTEHGRSTVSNCDIILSNGRSFSTSVIDPEEVKIKPDQNLQAVSKDNGKGDYNPSIFEMPFHSCPGHSEIIVSVSYIRDMDLVHGNYQLLVPITVPEQLMYYRDLRNFVSIDCLIYAGTVGCKWGSGSHPVIRKQGTDPNCIEFEYDPTKDVINADFSFYYHVWTSDIVGSCIVQNGKDIKSEGAFVLFLSPSANDSAIMARRVVFLLDHSGSMYGEPISQAKESLITALHGLNAFDEFAICAFDDKEIWFGGENNEHNEHNEHNEQKRGEKNTVPKLISTNNVQSAINWVREIKADWGTDILKTYRESINLLTQAAKESHKLGMVVLITDGCVSNEHEICKYGEDYAKEVNKGLHNDAANSDMVRTFTFGIGPFCNTGFLRALASIGHGYSHTTISIEDLKNQMTQFMQKTNSPELSGISLIVNPGKDCVNIDICPRQIPDLSAGSPLIVVGTFQGKFPAEIVIHGNTSDLKQHTINVTCLSNNSIPVHNLVARQKIDQLIGKWWLAGNDVMKKKQFRTEAVALAIATSTPCAFTNSIAYESTTLTPSSNPKQISNASTTANNSVAASSEILVARNRKPSMKKGAILLGTAAGAAIVFGSVAATQGNISIADVQAFINSSGFSPDIFNSFQISPPNLDGVFGNVDTSSMNNMFNNIPTPNFGDMPVLSDLPSVDTNACCCFNCDVDSLTNCNCVSLDAISSCSCINLDAISSCGCINLDGFCNIIAPCTESAGLCCGQCFDCANSIAPVISDLCNCLGSAAGGICEVLGALGGD